MFVVLVVMIAHYCLKQRYIVFPPKYVCVLFTIFMMVGRS